jgi:FkbM family methyltransferase
MLPDLEIINANNNSYFLMKNRDLIGQEIRIRGDFAKSERMCCEKFLANKTQVSVLDIGANIGAFTIGVAKFLHKIGGRLICFEPQRIVFQQLCANIFLNQLDNVHAFNLAVGEKNKTIDLPIIDFHKSTNPGGFSVNDDIRGHLNQEYEKGTTAPNIYQPSNSEKMQIITIDSLNIEDEIGFLKIDVEGGELEVLIGAQHTLKKNNYPPIVFEDWGNKFSWYKEKSKNTFLFVNSLGYDITNLEGRNYLAAHPLNKVN